MQSTDDAMAIAVTRSAKADLRKRMGNVLRTLPPNSINEQSAMVHKNLFSMPEYQRAKSVSIFLSMPKGEIQTAAIVHHAFDHGKTVFIPYLRKSQVENGPKSVMDMVELRSKEDFAGLKPDKWGIPSLQEESLPGRQRTPGDHMSNAQIAELDLILMPGVAFDKNLQRIGHGKGYYDFFLRRYHMQTRRMEAPFLVALALQQQVLPGGEDIPADNSDWHVDALVVGDGSIIHASS